MYIYFQVSCMPDVPLFVFCNILVDFEYAHMFIFILCKIRPCASTQI